MKFLIVLAGLAAVWFLLVFGVLAVTIVLWLLVSILGAL